jgi:hypothetical protein
MLVTFDPNCPLPAVEARKLVRLIIKEGFVDFTDHALKELANDGMSTVDAINVLRAGAIHEAEWENGGWRYHAETQRFRVVFELESESECLVITAMRFKR